MNNEINLAQLLKDCPEGMELDCTMFENLEFDGIVTHAYFPIRCRVKHPDGGYHVYNFTKYGCWNNIDVAKCVIFPKGKTTWEGFVPPCKFKDGDIVSTTHGNWIGITKGGKNNEFIPVYCVIMGNGKFEAYFDEKGAWYFDGLATEEQKQKLFDAIKANGYKWNAETKTLETLIEPKFKVGDRIKSKENYNYIHTITGIREKENKYECGVNLVLRFSDQDNWELVPNKFDINSLKPFDKVLVRDSDIDMWCASMFSHTWKDKYYCVGLWRNQCIPYEGNQHLLGVTDNCDEYYKVWE